MDAQTRPLYSTRAELEEYRTVDATIGRMAREAEALACSASHLLADVLRVKHASVKATPPYALLTDLCQAKQAIQRALAELTNVMPDAGRTDPNEPND